MMGPDLEVLKDVPGYQAILKAVLKTQIQLLVEQLSSETGEESVLLTASVTEGTLSHLGSESGKVFLDGHEDIKSQFLGFCLKRYQKRKAPQSTPDFPPRRDKKSHGEKRPRLHPAFPTSLPSPSVSTQNPDPISFVPPIMINREAAAFNIPIQTQTSRETNIPGTQLVPNPSQVSQILPHIQGQQLLPEATPVGSPFQVQLNNQSGVNPVQKSKKSKLPAPSLNKTPSLQKDHETGDEANAPAAVKAELLDKTSIEYTSKSNDKVLSDDHDQNKGASAVECSNDNTAKTDDGDESADAGVKIIKREQTEDNELEIMGIEMGDTSQLAFGESNWGGSMGAAGLAPTTDGDMDAIMQDYMRNWNERHSHRIHTAAANATGHDEGQSTMENDLHTSGDMDILSEATRRRGSVRKRKHRDDPHDPLHILPDALASLPPPSAKTLPVLPPPQQFAELTHFPKLAPNTPNYPLCSGSVGVHLINQDLWRLFYSSQTEMILTKSGRRMFPVLEFHPFGLDPDKLYNVYVDMPAVSKYTWKFQDCAWVATGERKSDAGNIMENVCVHPESPGTGNFWMKHGILFDKLKLTNNSLSARLIDQIYLVSMHLYQPRLNVTEANTDNPNDHLAFAFPETQFIAITAYNNTIMTQLKIEHNKFAKGFRDTAGTDMPLGFRMIERLKTTEHRKTERKSSERRSVERRHVERTRPDRHDRRYAEFRDTSAVASASQLTVYGRGQVNPDAVQTPEMKKIIELIQQRELEDERNNLNNPYVEPVVHPTSDTNVNHSDNSPTTSPTTEELHTIAQVPSSGLIIDLDETAQREGGVNDEEPPDSIDVPLYNRLFLEAQGSRKVPSGTDDDVDKDINPRFDIETHDGTADTHDTVESGTVDVNRNEDCINDNDEKQTIVIQDNAAGQWVVKMEHD